MYSAVDKIADMPPAPVGGATDDEVEPQDDDDEVVPGLIPLEDLDQAVVLYQQPKILISRDTRGLNEFFKLYIPVLFMTFDVLFMAIDGSFRMNKTRPSIPKLHINPEFGERWDVGRTDGERIEQAWLEMSPDLPRRRRDQVRAKL